jgi:hypothetical protein
MFHGFHFRAALDSLFGCWVGFISGLLWASYSDDALILHSGAVYSTSRHLIQMLDESPFRATLGLLNSDAAWPSHSVAVFCTYLKVCYSDAACISFQGPYGPLIQILHWSHFRSWIQTSYSDVYGPYFRGMGLLFHTLHVSFQEQYTVGLLFIYLPSLDFLCDLRNV